MVMVDIQRLRKAPSNAADRAFSTLRCVEGFILIRSKGVNTLPPLSLRDSPSLLFLGVMVREASFCRIWIRPLLRDALVVAIRAAWCPPLSIGQVINPAKGLWVNDVHSIQSVGSPTWCELQGWHIGLVLSRLYVPPNFPGIGNLSKVVIWKLSNRPHPAHGATFPFPNALNTQARSSRFETLTAHTPDTRRRCRNAHTPTGSLRASPRRRDRLWRCSSTSTASYPARG